MVKNHPSHTYPMKAKLRGMIDMEEKIVIMDNRLDNRSKRAVGVGRDDWLRLVRVCRMVAQIA